MKEKALDFYTENYQYAVKENKESPAEEQVGMDAIIQWTLNETAKKFFDPWVNAARRQKSYLRKGLFMNDMMPKKFIDRVKRLNEALPYFPVADSLKPCQSLPEDEVIDILDGAKKGEWHITMMSQGKRPDAFETIEEAQEYYTQLYCADKLMKKLSSTSKKDSNKKKRKHPSKENGKGKPCEHCGKKGHLSKDCWTLEKNKRHRPNNYKSKKTYTSSETANMIKTLFKSMKDTELNCKCKVQFKKESEEDNFMAQLKKLTSSASGNSSVSSASSTNSDN